MMTATDIAVVGGGVAGLSAVRALQQAGSSPLHIAPARSRSRNRGELLGPRALASLETLEWRHLLDDPRLALRSEARFSAWGSPALVPVPVDPDLGLGWYVDREALEAAMHAEVSAGPVQRLDASLTSCEREDEAWRLTLSTGDEIRARFLIDASGRGAAVTRRFGGTRQRDSRLVALLRTLTVPDAAVMAASLIESAPDGWWYTSPVPKSGHVFTAYFTDSDLLPDGASRRPEVMDDLLSAAPLTCDRLESLGETASTAPARIILASTVRQECVAGDGWAAAGDAAAALDPLAGHGLTVALWSAVQVGRAAHAWLGGDDARLTTYQKAVTTGMRRFVADAERHYRAERRFRDRPFWSRRHAASD